MNSVFRAMATSSLGKWLTQDVTAVTLKRRAKKRRMSADAIRTTQARGARREAGLRNSIYAASIVLEGVLTAGTQFPFAAAGQDFSYDESTWVIGEIVLGARATVSCVISSEGAHHAKKIVIGLG